MNLFNIILQAVKKHCGDTDYIEDVKCFEAIALDTHIPLDRLYGYLEVLQNLELIKFSEAGHYIQVTAAGRQKEELFST